MLLQITNVLGLELSSFPKAARSSVTAAELQKWIAAKPKGIKGSSSAVHRHLWIQRRFRRRNKG